jgi:hypothetical protein
VVFPLGYWYRVVFRITLKTSIFRGLMWSLCLSCLFGMPNDYFYWCVSISSSCSHGKHLFVDLFNFQLYIHRLIFLDGVSRSIYIDTTMMREYSVKEEANVCLKRRSWVIGIICWNTLVRSAGNSCVVSLLVCKKRFELSHISDLRCTKVKNALQGDHTYTSWMHCNKFLSNLLVNSS